MKVFLLAAMLCVSCGQDSKNETQEFKPSLWSEEDENSLFDGCMDNEVNETKETFCLCVTGYFSRTYERDVFAANAIDIIEANETEIKACAAKAEQINGEG